MHRDSNTGALRPAISRREAFRTIGLGAALGLAGAGAVYAATPTMHDPLLDLIQRYKAEQAFVDARCREKTPTDAELDEMSIGLDAAYYELRDRTPPATTQAGALEALRFATDRVQVDWATMAPALIGAALAFLDRNAA